MNVYKNKSLRRINARTHHLIQGFPSFLTPDQIKNLKSKDTIDYLQIAQYQEQLGLLTYLDVK